MFVFHEACRFGLNVTDKNLRVNKKRNIRS